MAGESRAGFVLDFITQALTEEEIRTLALAHFRAVYEEYSAAMSRTELIRRLVEGADRTGRLAELVDLTAQLNPVKGAGARERLASLPEPLPPAPPARPRPRSLIVHPLPPASAFVGRTAELAALDRFWDEAPNGLFCLFALGGAGKTAIAAQFLERIQADARRRPDNLLVWSFYESPDAQGFLDMARATLSPEGASPDVSTAAAYYMILQALENGERNLIILDGLERVQRSDGGIGQFGEITDPTLAQLVRRLAAGLDRTKVIITSRFALPRMEPWLSRTFWLLDVTSMTMEDACALLAGKGVHGSEAALRKTVVAYGAHALTLDHLGGYLCAFSDGSADGASALPEPRLVSASIQEYRLARVLSAYESALTEQELALLSRLCIFRSSRTAQELCEIFSATASDADRIAGPLRGLGTPDYERLMTRLAALHLAIPAGAERWTAHPAVRDYFGRRFADADLADEAARRHFARLVEAPGTQLASSEAVLDSLEELVYHTLRLGRITDAVAIYFDQIGGAENLGWRLGQYGRCVRMLEQFPQCPDIAGLIWCYRALGDLDAAERLIEPDDLWWLGMIGCLRGRLAEVTSQLTGVHGDAILTICEVLTGRADARELAGAPHWPGLPISVADAWLLVGREHEAMTAAAHIASDRGNDEGARADLILADVARRKGDLHGSRGLLDKASQWIFKSGSQEHLCRLHLAEAQLALDSGRLEDASTRLRQGLAVAAECGFGLMHIDLLVEDARLAIAERRFAAAATAALSALNGIGRDMRPCDKPDGDPGELVLLGALHPLCHYQWGMERARYYLRQADSS